MSVTISIKSIEVLGIVEGTNSDEDAVKLFEAQVNVINEALNIWGFEIYKIEVEDSDGRDRELRAVLMPPIKKK